MQTADLIPLLDHWVAREREKQRERTVEETDQIVEMASQHAGRRSGRSQVAPSYRSITARPTQTINS